MSPVEAHARRYLERYEQTSRANLRRILAKKGEPEEVARVLDLLVAEGRLDDARYAQARAGALARRGVSKIGIRARLAAKGVRDTTVAVDELASCCEYVRRRRLGPFGVVPADKSLQRLVRAGFPYDLAKRVLAMEEEEIREKAAG